MNIKTSFYQKRKGIIAAAFAVFLLAAGFYSLQKIGFAAVTRVPNPIAGSTDTLRIYLYAGGSDTNDGMSATSPVKTFRRASAIAQAKWDQGLARGDVEVRLAGTYTAVADYYKSWTFAPAEGKYVRFIPRWYTNEADASNRDPSEWPVFSGASNPTYANMPFKIEPEENKGGSYEFAYMKVEYYNNGILLDGGVPMRDNDALDPAKVDKGVRMGYNAPIERPIFRNMTFTNMGSKYAPGHGNSFGSVRPWNTNNALVRSVHFKNLDEDPVTMSIHGVYGYRSFNTIVENSTFDTVKADPIRYRDSGGWTIRNNTFRKAGFTANVSQWYSHKELDDSYVDDTGTNMRRLSECEGVKATGSTANNNTDGLSYEGLPNYRSWGQWYPFEFHRSATLIQADICTEPTRVFAPETSGQQTGEGTYAINWTKPRTLSGDIARYKIYKGDSSDMTGQLVATVPVGTNSYTLTGLQAQHDTYYYVLAEGTAGGVSPRTENRRWFNLVGYRDEVDTTAPTVVLTAPLNNVTVDRSVPIAVNATDNVAVTKVEFYEGTNKIGERTVAPWRITWDTTNVPNGTYSITAAASDAAGNRTTSSFALTVNVLHPQPEPTPDTTAPEVSITSPTDGASFTDSVRITASAEDNVGVSRLEFYNGSTKIGEVTSEPYVLNWNTTELAAGSYTITARAFDAAGNTTLSTPVSITIVRDSPPVDEPPFDPEPIDPETRVTRLDINVLPKVSGVDDMLSRGVLTVDANTTCADITAAGLLGPDSVTSPQGVRILGGITFTLACTSNGGSSPVNLQLGSAVADTSQLRFYKSNGNVLTDVTNRMTISTNAGVTNVSYTLTDGGSLDEDGMANGVVVDPLYIGTLAVNDPAPIDPTDPTDPTDPNNPVDPPAEDHLAETGQAVWVAAVGAIALIAGGAVVVRKLTK